MIISPAAVRGFFCLEIQPELSQDSGVFQAVSCYSGFSLRHIHITTQLFTGVDLGRSEDAVIG